MADEQAPKDITTRNLVDADVGPLRRVIGTLTSIPQAVEEYGEGVKKRFVTRVTVFLTDIEILELIEPYQLPTFTIMLSISNKRKSKWGFFSDGSPEEKAIGFNNIADQQYSPEQLNPESPQFIEPRKRMDVKDAIGKRMGMVLADGEEGRPKSPMLWDGRVNAGEGADVPTMCWTVYMIEGIGVVGGQGATPYQLAVDLLDGKTLKEFNDAALANPVITGDGKMLQALSLPVTAPNSFTNALVTAGTFIKDEATGIFHKVTGGAVEVAPEDLPF